ncbi:MAG: hypothetical protein AB1416_13700 [Actinomycetota bacterium]
MPNHLTPEELSEVLGMDRGEVVRICIEESVPIYNGRIDKTLFVHSIAASGRRLPDTAYALMPSAGAP